MQEDRIIYELSGIFQSDNPLLLKGTFLSFLREHVNSDNVDIFQIQLDRNERGFGKATYILDCSRKDTKLLLEDFPNMSLAYNSQKTVRIRSKNGSSNKIIIPIIEGSQITHLIRIVFPPLTSSIDNKIDLKKIKEIIKIFSSFLYLLNSKTIDPLTGLFNRLAYNSFIVQIFNNDHRVMESGKRFSCLSILDIDNFKNVNDSFGHLIGDEVLVHMAQLMRSSFRPMDQVFRYGGEEFICALQDVDEKSSKDILNRFRQKVEEYLFPAVGHATMSIGYVIFEQHESPLRVLDKADRSLYFAKKNGKNQVCSYYELTSQHKIESIDDSSSEIAYF